MHTLAPENKKDEIKEAKEDASVSIFFIDLILLTEKHYDYSWVHISANK